MWVLVPQTQRPLGRPSSWQGLPLMLAQVGTSLYRSSLLFGSNRLH